MKVILIQLRQLGDVLLTSPLAKAIKENLKECEVHFLTSQIGAEILKGNPYIDRIVQLKEGVKEEVKTLLQIRRENYDAVIDVQRTGRSQRLTFLSGAPLKVGFKKGRNYFYSRLVEWENRGYTTWERLKLLEPLGLKIENYQRYLPEFFNYREVKELSLPERYFVVVPTARKKEKMWPAEKFARLITEIYRSLKVPAVLLYGPGEVETVRKVTEETEAKVIYPQKPLPIGESATVIKNGLFFVGLNSFASHLSVASGTKTVVIDKRHSGWFPPVETVREIHGNGEFPEVEEVLKAALSFAQ